MSIFNCPSDSSTPESVLTVGPNAANYARIRGNYVVNWGNTVYGQVGLPTVTFGVGPFTFGKGLPISDIKDGVSNTILLSECVPMRLVPADTYGGPIGDISVANGGQTFNGLYPPNSKLPDAIINTTPLVQTDWLNGIPQPDQSVNDYRLQTFVARSKHSGGVHAAMCDGSVHFISDRIKVGVWQSLTTAKGNELIDSTEWR